MRIIADSGSTKTSWVLVAEGREPFHFNTEGFNPFYVDSAYIYQSIIQNFPTDFPFDKVKDVFFYGAGCTPSKSEIVIGALKKAFPSCEADVSSDLYAAAKALVGDNLNFVSILGTGTNTAVFNQGKVVYQIPSLGFLLGDEGSGAYMGRKLLSLYAKGVLKANLQQAFETYLGISQDQLVAHFYEQKLPNRFSASVVPFILEHIQEPEIYKIVYDSFNDYFKNVVVYYPDYKKYTLNVMGSIAYNFRDVLAEVASQHQMEVGKIYRSPMEGLVSYHS